MEVVILHQQVPEAGLPGSEAEQDVLVQVELVAGVLERLGHAVAKRPCDPDLEELRQELTRRRPGLAFNLVESLAGDDRLAAAAPILLEALRIPYTGAPAAAWLLAADKRIMKRHLTEGGIPTPPWCDGTLPGEPPEFPGDFVIKTVGQHASWGLTDDCVVHVANEVELAEQLRHVERRIGYPCFAEQYIEGREFNVSLLADRNDVEVLPIAEIVFADYPSGKPRIVGYAAKWQVDSFEYQHTPRRFDLPEEDQPLLEQLARLAQEVWKRFGMRGYARVDFRVDRHGRPWVLEVNPNPCLSPDAGFAAACAQAGLSTTEVIGRIVQAALVNHE
ncbi:MAG: D-alanine--D-alanine ligase [Pirellulaceae bacterium]|nr:MAG: D-alanine--D-alanine ligase [Pirellulaceae bacterium]